MTDLIETLLRQADRLDRIRSAKNDDYLTPLTLEARVDAKALRDLAERLPKAIGILEGWIEYMKASGVQATITSIDLITDLEAVSAALREGADEREERSRTTTRRASES
jgi:hypothetical protein